MMECEEWGPWIDHDGKSCPVPDGVWCHREFDQPASGEDMTAVGLMECLSPVINSWEWRSWLWEPGAVRIIRYRIRKPRALKQLRALAENPPSETPLEKVSA